MNVAKDSGFWKAPDFWKVCEALDCPMRLTLLTYLLALGKDEEPCVIDLADHFHMSGAVISTHLKKLAEAGLIVARRHERRALYRAEPTTPVGVRVMDVLRPYLLGRQSEGRQMTFTRFVHALSLERRLRLVRILHKTPGLSLTELSDAADMPAQTVDRQLEELDRARIVDMNGIVCTMDCEPERALLSLALESIG